MGTHIQGSRVQGDSCPGELMSHLLQPLPPSPTHSAPSYSYIPFLTLLFQLQLFPLFPIIAPTCFSCSDEGIGRGRKRGGKLRSKRKSRRGRGRKRRKMEEGAGGGIGERNYPSLPYCSPKGHFVIFGRMTFRKIN